MRRPHRQPPATILSLRTATERDADYPHRGAVQGWLRANCACLTEVINNAYVYRETDLRAWSQEASRLKRKHMCKRHPKSQGHPKVTPKWSKRRHKVIPKSSQSDPPVVQTSSQSDSKVIGQYEGLTRPHKVSQGLTRPHKVSQGPALLALVGKLAGQPCHHRAIS